MKLCSLQSIIGVGLLAAVSAGSAAAQDTFNAPRGQQIPPPSCFTIRGAWEGGYNPCTPLSHTEWLADVTHWRMERRIGATAARYWAKASSGRPAATARAIAAPAAAPLSSA